MPKSYSSFLPDSESFSPRCPRLSVSLGSRGAASAVGGGGLLSARLSVLGVVRGGGADEIWEERRFRRTWPAGGRQKWEICCSPPSSSAGASASCCPRSRARSRKSKPCFLVSCHMLVGGVPSLWKSRPLIGRVQFRLNQSTNVPLSTTFSQRFFAVSELSLPSFTPHFLSFAEAAAKKTRSQFYWDIPLTPPK